MTPDLPTIDVEELPTITVEVTFKNSDKLRTVEAAYDPAADELIGVFSGGWEVTSLIEFPDRAKIKEVCRLWQLNNVIKSKK